MRVNRCKRNCLLYPKFSTWLEINLMERNLLVRFVKGVNDGTYGASLCQSSSVPSIFCPGEIFLGWMCWCRIHGWRFHLPDPWGVEEDQPVYRKKVKIVVSCIQQYLNRAGHEKCTMGTWKFIKTDRISYFQIIWLSWNVIQLKCVLLGNFL